jgi:hypothetical protein
LIITHITGGIGNQMFQYAAGRALSLERKQPLRLDVSGFAGNGPHQGFELQRVFDCPVEIATQAEMRNILGWQSPARIRRVLARPSLAGFCRDGFIVEPHFHYWPEIKNVSSASYLHGYWQSEKYFRQIASVILADFTFKIPFTSRNAELADHIKQVDAVSLHVRRGDYVRNEKTNARHGLCSLQYYQAAIQNISEKVEQSHFFIFSDDIAWAKDNLSMDLPCQYVDLNRGAESYNDMHLMSVCRHHIIANSSFSWWAAWLNPDQEKIVVAPKKWFADEKKLNIKDLFPQGWVTL